MRTISSLVASLCVAIPLISCESTAPGALADNPWSLMGKGNYHGGLKVAEKNHQGTNPDPMAMDSLAVLRAAVGDYQGAKALHGENGSGGDHPLESHAELDQCEPLDALATLVELAKDRQVVILNEAHHVPETRHLTAALIEILTDHGFKYLACEAFSPQIIQVAQVGYPTLQNTFVYVQEPVFAQLVRRAIQLDYKLIHYETELHGSAGDQIDSINSREIEQSRHLMERIFAADPEARVLVHCGYSHATEDWRTLEDGRELAWMAARLQRLLGIDPLTIDQTRQRSGADPQSGPAVWEYAVRKGRVPRPTVFRKKDGSFFVEGPSWKGRVDLQVFHPVTEIEDGRPVWLSNSGNRQPVEIPVELEPTEDRVLIQAFVASESAHAIPMDQVLWYADDLSPMLLLPPGEYRVVAQDTAGEVVDSVECVVE